MKNITEFLKDVVEFQDFAAKRGYELMMALGCKWKMYTMPDKIQFSEDSAEMTFCENTGHDCPDYETICLKLGELEKTDEEWELYIENTKKETAEKERIKKQREEDMKLQEKEKQYQTLKKELNK